MRAALTPTVGTPLIPGASHAAAARADQMHAHSHYEYFRALLADRYQQNLEALLSFLCEVTQVPVLLSLLLVIFKSRGLKQREVTPPTKLHELYTMAAS